MRGQDSTWVDWEAAIVERLQAQMDPGTNVFTLADVDEMRASTQKFPAAAVIYDGFVPEEDNGPTGRICLLRHDWLIVLGARSAAGKGDPINAKRIVGAMARQALRALLGFDVDGNGRFMHAAASPGPEYDGGDCYQPLVFNVRATERGGS